MPPCLFLSPICDYHLVFSFSFAAEQLRLPLIPANSDASGHQVLNGINYASAAAGILDVTARSFVSRVPSRNQYNGRQFADLLIQEYSRQQTTFYNLGARKFVVAGLGVMGCIPSILAQSPAGICSDLVNQLAQPFNENLKSMLNNFNVKLPGAKFIFIDCAHIFREILTNSPAYGFCAS
ncbi:hypothetical protein SADUNF_Sadunf13G0082100 [Salix dunnii]|uniref:GDSL esterase/lipase n=1 Tax=Salix dunnii TaxID=1413687 RepID=A0A835MNI2_9ROSI|nr:hypothetical protein SADUNF_Sadunf13G0082100 [Salix dunnii]